MTWDTLATINTSTNWQYTPLVVGKVFRLRHISNSTHPQDLRAVIGQVFQEDVEMFYNTHRLTFKPEVEIYVFVQPPEFFERGIAVKRLDNLADSWSIEIEALDAVFIPSETDNLSLEFNRARAAIALGVI